MQKEEGSGVVIRQIREQANANVHQEPMSGGTPQTGRKAENAKNWVDSECIGHVELTRLPAD